MIRKATYRPYYLLFSALLVVVLSAPKAALSQSSDAESPAIRDLQVSDFSVPEKLGYVLETHAPGSSSSPILIHIQEAHANLEAQKNMIEILRQLVKDYGLRLILVEGGHGDVGLAYLRDYGPVENRVEVAEKYLSMGLISAEEYLDIVSDFPLTLWGVEDEALYKSHVDAFLAVERIQPSIEPALAGFREALEVVKGRLSDPDLTELDTKRAAFEANTLGLGEYAEFLSSLAGRRSVSAAEHVQLARFLTLRRLEKELSLEQVRKEQQALITQLSTQISEAELNGLIDLAKQMKSGAATSEQFYRRLSSLAAGTTVSLEAFPQVAGYTKYVIEKSRLQATRLADELDALADHVRSRLVEASEGGAIYRLADQVELLGKMARLKLSPQEYARLSEAQPLTDLPQRWAETLNAELVRAGLPMRTFDGIQALTTALPQLTRFYEAANIRDKALVANSLAKISETKERVAVLITGGFHAPQMTRLLQEGGLGLIAVAPKVGGETDEALYHAVLKYKSGHGTFEDVQAAALRAAPAAAKETAR